MYKYCQRKYLAKMLKSGSVRVGTVLDYRKQELHGGSIGDEMEGWIRSGQIPRELPPEGIPGFIGLADGARMTIEDVAFDGGDAYVFSLATELSSEGAARWLNDKQAEYDAAYKVTDINGFVDALGRGLAAQVGPLYGRMAPVDYYDPDAPDWGCFDQIAFCKPAPFSWQVEFRLVFYPKSSHDGRPLAPVNLKVPALRRFVSPRTLPKD